VPQKFPGVNRVTRQLADGSERVYYYHRGTGRRLDGEPPEDGQPITPAHRAFIASYTEAEIVARAPVAVAPAPRKTLADLLEDFINSPEHRRCAPSTRRNREAFLSAAKARFSWMYVEDLNRRAVRGEFFAWRDEMASMPRKADAAIETLGRALAWAYDRGTIDVNHARGIGRLTPRGYSRRDKIWTPAVEAAFLAAAEPEIRRLYLFLLFTAARIGDACLLSKRPRLADDKGWIGFRPQKTARSTGAEVWLPAFELPPFAELLREIEDGSPEGHKLRSMTGKPWKWGNAYQHFQETMNDAGLRSVDLHIHDIRGTTVTRLFEAGCTDAEVASITGHALGGDSKLRDYADRSRVLAVNAYRKWAAAMSAESNVTPLRAVK
jgi:hypothetical protein